MVNTGRRAGLSQQAIAQCAVALTGERGLQGWSIRDLAGELGVVPSVIYHYYAAKDDLYDAVLAEVLQQVPIPDESLEWKSWFRHVARDMRPILLAHHGVTEWLKFGRFAPAGLPLLESGLRHLRDAGFGEHAVLAFAMFTNTVVNAIGQRNLRDPHQPGKRHDLDEMIEYLQRSTGESAALSEMLEQWLVPLAGSREDDLSEAYFGTLVEVVLAGLEQVYLRSDDAPLGGQ